MTDAPYILLDVFTDRPFGGNPLAVFPDARNIDPVLFPRIAKELNLSETAYVLPPREPGHLAHLRIFTPGMELPFAGHPTVGTAAALVTEGAVAVDEDGAASFVLGEAVGPIQVTVGRRDGCILARFRTARDPERGPDAPGADLLAAMLSLEAGDLLPEEGAPAFWSCGVPFLFVPVRDRAALGRARVDPSLWSRHLAEAWGSHLYVYCRDPEETDHHVRARMFAPDMGIGEDPATGAAASALAGVLASSVPEGDHVWVVEQGWEMGRPSLITVSATVKGGDATAVHVGGTSVVMGRGLLHLPT